jgi:hypothetical protein
MKRKILVIASLSVLLVLSFIIRAKAYAPELELKDQPIENIVTYFAEVNGLDPKLALAVMRCESGGIQSTVGDKGHSHGIFQYFTDTWERHSKELGETLDINSPFDQAKLATFAIAHGHGNEWTTYTAIKNGGKYSFYSKINKKHYTVRCELADV